MENDDNDNQIPKVRAYQQEMLDESLQRNIIIALDTGSGKTLIAVLRLKHEMEREPVKLSWFFAPTVALCEQQKAVISGYLPVSVGLVSGANEPDQWKDSALWHRVLKTHRIMVSTPQVFLDALRHGYISLGRDISLLIFDEAHHAADNHPYNKIMEEFYFDLSPRSDSAITEVLRPMILGLTASPIYGGNVIKAFENLEKNLDSTIRSPRKTREELAKYVHPPTFQHATYTLPSIPHFSTNLAALIAVTNTIDIEDDPYVGSLRRQLAKASRGTSEYHRTDQKLSKVIQMKNSFTHKGLRDFENAARDICDDLGPWAADWFVYKVLERAKEASNPYSTMMVTWKNKEKEYLLNILNKIVVSPISYYPDDIECDGSDKLRVLIDCLLFEKKEAESENEFYSGIIFVERRDSVLALAEILKHHPRTKDVFRVGTLIGTSESARRHSLMDITRKILREPQEITLSDFKSGEKNLIVSTAVAEEGIDIQACCSVIRWDLPQNMASWAQSRGRARKQRSSFTLLFEKGSKQQDAVQKWKKLECQMVELYNDPSRDFYTAINAIDVEDIEEDDMVFMAPNSDALLTLHSAISHLAHFCAVIPNSAHADNQPKYDVDPPEFPEGWHLFPSSQNKILYAGPYGSTVTLPRSLPLPNRQFAADRIYKSVISAHRHAAFSAYIALFEAGLLNDHLLPLTSLVDPELDSEVKAMLADVEKREGLANISLSVDPWQAEDDKHGDIWQVSELRIEGLPSLLLFTRPELHSADFPEGPTLYRSKVAPIRTSILPLRSVDGNDQVIPKAREYTRMIFWSLCNSRMEWDDLDFSYLVFPASDIDSQWQARRSWLVDVALSFPERNNYHYMARAEEFVTRFGYATDLTLIQKHMGFGRPYKFVSWHHEPLSSEDEEALLEQYRKLKIPNLSVTYPLLVVQAFPPKTNFLIPKKNDVGTVPFSPPPIYLLPQYSGITLLSSEEADFAFMLPSILRSLTMTMSTCSLRNNLFVLTPLSVIPIPLLTVALTAPASGETLNYQRMESLGDAVLKFITSVQLVAEYPLWHEGYLARKKDHTVSNVRLAKDNIKKQLYRWIIRDAMLGRKWKPRYFSTKVEMKVANDPVVPIADDSSMIEENSPTLKADPPVVPVDNEDSAMAEEEPKTSKKKTKKTAQLSTKVLADVVESVIGAAYLHGGFSMGYKCIKFFDLGLKWQPLPTRISQILTPTLSLSLHVDQFPSQLADVEYMLGYTFRHKLLLIEALTHGSYQHDTPTPSYERMEFLGDSVLDMIVTDYLYHAPGKNYSPGHIHLRRSAMVNGHILSYFCLKMHRVVQAVMPRPNADSGAIEVEDETKEIHLYKCLLHSNQKVLEDQLNTFSRFQRLKDEIEESLNIGTIFPWAALTKLQSPKFFSDMVESIIGAIYLDSGGSIPVVRDIVSHFGILPLLERVVRDDVDVLHPISRLSLWSAKNEKQIEYVIGRAGGKVSCAILVDTKEELKVTDEWRGKASQEEVKFAAAEMAIKEFRLRDVGVSYELLKEKRSKPKKKMAKMTKKMKTGSNEADKAMQY